MTKIANFGTLFAAVIFVASCSVSGTSARSSGASASSSDGPTTFTSATYRYTLTLPPQWTAVQASARWDGESELAIDSTEVDQFYPTVSGRGSYAVAKPWKRDLAAYTTFLIGWNYRYHGQFCPPKPDVRTTVTIGRQSGVLLEYNCGILINIAATIHHGVAYEFVFRDSTVPAASSPADHAQFAQILSSVQFPD